MVVPLTPLLPLPSCVAPSVATNTELQAELRHQSGAGWGVTQELQGLGTPPATEGRTTQCHPLAIQS